jgi:hypothetical protein
MDYMRYREKINRLLVPCILFLLFSIFFTVYLNSIDKRNKNYYRWNFIFDADTARVIKVFTDARATSIDVDKHPLYVMFFKPAGRSLNSIVRNPARSTLLITAFAGAAAVPFVFLIFFRALRLPVIDSILFSILFGSSSSAWLMCSITETFSFNLLFIVLAFYLQSADTRRLSVSAHFLFNIRYMIFSIVATGVTITNGVYAFLGYLNFCRKQKTTILYKIVSALLFLFIMCFFLLLLSRVQHELYPKAFLFSGIKSLCSMYRREHEYVVCGVKNLFRWHGVIDFFRTFFFSNVVAPRAAVIDIEAFGYRWNMLGFVYRGGWLYNCTMLIYSLFLCGGLFCVFQKKLLKEKDLQLALFFILFNFILHAFYRAVGAPFIYSDHLVFSVVFLIARGYKESSFSLKRLFLVILLSLVIINNSLFIKQTNYLLRVSPVQKAVKVRCQ